jgi:hypothetical protein
MSRVSGTHNRELVAEYEDLDVLGRVGAGEHHHQTHELGDREVGQLGRHYPDHAMIVLE